MQVEEMLEIRIIIDDAGLLNISLFMHLPNELV